MGVTAVAKYVCGGYESEYTGIPVPAGGMPSKVVLGDNDGIAASLVSVQVIGPKIILCDCYMASDFPPFPLRSHRAILFFSQ